MDKYTEKRNIIEEIQADLFVDDLISAGSTESEADNIKNTAIRLFQDGGFHLHKWHSNIPSLEDTGLHDESSTNESEVTYAKKE